MTVETRVWPEGGHSIADIVAGSSAKPDWLVEPFIAIGAITEITGKVKLSGKSTLILDIVHSIIGDLPWAGFDTRRTGIAYLSEQSITSFRQTMRLANLDPDHLASDDLRVWFLRELRGKEWPAIIDRAIADCKTAGAELLVVDTIAKLAGIKHENDSADWMEAMDPLKKACDEGLAVVTARHSGLANRGVGESGRGSTGGSGEADILLNLARLPGNQHIRTRRVLEGGAGRYPETPELTAIELRPEGYAYIGDTKAATANAARVLIVESLTTQPGTNRNGLFAASAQVDPPIGEKSMRDALEALTQEGAIRTTGAGKHGDPFLYFLT